MSTVSALRVARPSDDIGRLLPFYVDGLGFAVLARFDDHEGFDGVILGHRYAPWHLEFTRQHGRAAGRAPSAEHLLVLYLPNDEYAARLARMRAAGFATVVSSNPYWDREGATFEDPDGYRIVLTRRVWSL